MTATAGVPAGLHSITPHIVVRDAAAAAAWYVRALGAEERNRVPLPGGKVLYVEVGFGDSSIMVADEFPDFGILSPSRSAARPSSCTCSLPTPTRSGTEPSTTGPRSCIRSTTSSGATGRDSSVIPTVTSGTSPSTCGTCRRRRSRLQRRRCSAGRKPRAAAARWSPGCRRCAAWSQPMVRTIPVAGARGE